MSPQADFQFSVDWFGHNIPTWKRFLDPLVGQPIQVLEIGVFEGRSVVWLLEHVLTHPKARLTAIDTFEGSMENQGHLSEVLEKLEDRFKANVATTGHADKVETIKSDSYSALVRLNNEGSHSYDLIYVDGSHMACDVLADAVLSWSLLKVGGILIFDDYKWRRYKDKYKNPKMAIDGFLKCHPHQIEGLHKGYQVIIRKKA